MDNLTQSVVGVMVAVLGLGLQVQVFFRWEKIQQSHCRSPHPY